MSFNAISWAVRQNTGDSGSKLVLIMIANYSDDEDRSYPSQEHIGLICHMSRRTVIRHIKKLNKKGFIIIEKISNGLKINNRYILKRGGTPKVTKTAKASDKKSQNTNINTFDNISNKKNKNFIAG